MIDINGTVQNEWMEDVVAARGYEVTVEGHIQIFSVHFANNKINVSMPRLLFYFRGRKVGFVKRVEQRLKVVDCCRFEDLSFPSIVLGDPFGMILRIEIFIGKHRNDSHPREHDSDYVLAGYLVP